MWCIYLAPYCLTSSSLPSRRLRENAGLSFKKACSGLVSTVQQTNPQQSREERERHTRIGTVSNGWYYVSSVSLPPLISSVDEGHKPHESPETIHCNVNNQQQLLHLQIWNSWSKQSEIQNNCHPNLERPIYEMLYPLNHLFQEMTDINPCNPSWWCHPLGLVRY